MKIRANLAVSESGFIFDPATGESFSTNETGRQIIALLRNGSSEAEIKQFFADNFDVDSNIFEKHFFDFLNLMSSMQLVEN
jgi:hypothetical protein